MRGFLLLEDGDSLEGELIGYQGETDGEVVFTTGMTGYVESLTDPSFAGQILTFTYPLMGNYGIPKAIMTGELLYQNRESGRIWVQGVVVSQYSSAPSHQLLWKTFDEWLKNEKIPGIAGIDTRALTIKLRDKGVMKGRISTKRQSVSHFRSCGQLVHLASVQRPIYYKPDITNGRHIALIDCGVKHGIIRALLKEGYSITRLPYNINPLQLSQKVDGVVVSNGPGDPKDCQATIATVRKIIKARIPLLGICLGHQLVALAVGADTYKLKYGHRGLNQPCHDLVSKKAYVTSQNHGFAVNPKTLPSGFNEWFINLNDGTNEGMIHTSGLIKSTQFHPEGSPGPFDTKWILRHFKSL